MASDKKAALEQRLERAGEILDRLWALTAQVCPANDEAGAFIYDELHKGPSPLLPLLRDYGDQIEATDEQFEHLHAEPIEVGPFTADSWHGVLAQWCQRVAGYASTSAGGLRRLLHNFKSAGAALGEANAVFRLHVVIQTPDDSATKDGPGATGPTGLRVGHSCPVMRRWAVDIKKSLEWFAGHIGEALDGLLPNGKKLKVGLDKERRHMAGQAARQKDAADDVAGSAILKHLLRNGSATTAALLDAVATAGASKRSGEAALQRLRREHLVDNAPRTTRGVYVLTYRGRSVAEQSKL